MNGWILLLLGIVFETAGTTCIKLSNGFSHLLPSVLTFVFFAIALSLITLSAKTIDVSVVYAVWSGVGIMLISLIGTFYFAEQITLPKMLFIGLILIGVIGLHQVSHQPVETDNVYSAK
ncbi:multidrug efflux SMR transporter [Amphritea sp. 1_MG-2023]|uniref:DMT family transporter n=1 Tax=Amphritea sp. 1_MG-2023 TaxID=3062670 RepID=UPI0026E2C310|nr:multidrug efflux SMR transporter [Amphritea sp. 1_MG-2023]MDO6563557.1 multidrug efflux SMR transporter [Amphritea sp. 1_MG-2023]